MKHPTPEACRAVAARFDSVKGYPGKVDMHEGGISKNECGTVACHAGWYLVAHLKGTPVSDWKLFDYRQGKELLIKDLGVAGEYYIVHWAEDYPELWGSKHGGCMFVSRIAFPQFALVDSYRSRHRRPLERCSRSD